MSKHAFVWPARVGEAQQFLDWSLANSGNGFDKNAVKYDGSFVLAAYNHDKTLSYLPVQRPFFVESFAPNPGASESEVVVALKELIQAIVTQAHIKGVGEIYFLGTSEATNEFATNQIFEEVPFKLYRVKLADLEKSDEK